MENRVVYLHWVRVVVFNSTFKCIVIILWQSVWLVEETGENQQPATSHWHTCIIGWTCYPFWHCHLTVASFIYNVGILGELHVCIHILHHDLACFSVNHKLVHVHVCIVLLFSLWHNTCMPSLSIWMKSCWKWHETPKYKALWLASIMLLSQ